MDGNVASVWGYGWLLFCGWNLAGWFQSNLGWFGFGLGGFFPCQSKYDAQKISKKKKIELQQICWDNSSMIAMSLTSDSSFKGGTSTSNNDHSPTSQATPDLPPTAKRTHKTTTAASPKKFVGDTWPIYLSKSLIYESSTSALSTQNLPRFLEGLFLLHHFCSLVSVITHILKAYNFGGCEVLAGWTNGTWNFKNF